VRWPYTWARCWWKGKRRATPGRWLAVGETLAVPVRLLGHAAPGEMLVSAPIGRLMKLGGGAERTLPSGPGSPGR